MRQRFLICCLLWSAGFVGGQASAQTYSAEARVFGISNTIPIGFESDAGNAPVTVGAGTADPGNPATSGAATATAAQGRVSGYSVTNSSGQRLIGYTRASSTFSDVLFSWAGEGPAPGTIIHVGLRYGIQHDQFASGPLGSSNGRNYRQFTATASFNDASDSVTATYDVGGDTVPPGLEERVLWSDVPIGSPVSVNLTLEVASAAYMAALPGPTETSMAATMRVGSVAVGLGSFADAVSQGVDPSRIAFLLPAGYTANSASMGVIDNVWVVGQVPEPATLATLLAGLVLIGSRVRARGVNWRH